MAGYGKLSRVEIDQTSEYSRVESDEYEKESARDFVLWKAKKDNEPAWQTAIGEGRPGVPLKAIVDKLTNTRFEPSGFTENPAIRYSSSVLDYIARWLGGKFISSEYLKPRTSLSEEEVATHATGASAVAKPKTASPQGRPPSSLVLPGDAPSCSTCGMLMVPNGSCYKCVNCGGTSGCS